MSLVSRRWIECGETKSLSAQIVRFTRVGDDQKIKEDIVSFEAWEFMPVHEE